MEQEKIMWVVIGVLVAAAAFVFFWNQPAAAQIGTRAASAMVGGC